MTERARYVGVSRQPRATARVGTAAWTPMLSHVVGSRSQQQVTTPRLVEAARPGVPLEEPVMPDQLAP